MLKAKNKKGEEVLGRNATKTEDYYCPHCQEELVVKKGEIKIHHFAHVAESECPYGAEETETHLRMKEFLFNYYSGKPFVRMAELEYFCHGNIADVYLEDRKGNSFAIECQCSPIEKPEMINRTKQYSKKGIYTLWIFGARQSLDEKLKRMKNGIIFEPEYFSNETEKMSHTWNYGRVYYFFEDRIYSIHFEPVNRWIPGACEGCLKEKQCDFKKKGGCPDFFEGRLKTAKNLRRISVREVHPLVPVGFKRQSGLRFGRFLDRRWWNIVDV